jgi:hypothetical protein
MRSKLQVESKESGQVLVLIVLAIVGIIGFAALALDGGLILSERRRAQNAADASVLAAALAKIQGNNLFTTALQMAGNNGFSTVGTDCDPKGYDCFLGISERWTVEVSNPPRSGDLAGNSNYVQLVITSEVETAFAHLVFSGPLQTTVQAVSRVWSEERLAAGHALYAATEHDCKAIWFTGTGDTCNSGEQDGGGIVNVDGEINVVGTFEEGGSGSVYPQPTEGVSPDNLRAVPQPYCSNLPEGGAVQVNAGKVVTINPGNYESITFKTPDSELILRPGMYCIYGSKGFTGNGGMVSVEGSDGGPGVMIYLQRGPFDLGGNTEVNLHADPDKLLDGRGRDWRGMLVYMDPANNSGVKITGTSDSTYEGTIFAPSSECVVQGTGDTLGLGAQVICYTVKVAGTAEVVINYNADLGYNVPPAIDLVD